MADLLRLRRSNFGVQGRCGCSSAGQRGGSSGVLGWRTPSTIFWERNWWILPRQPNNTRTDLPPQ